MAERKRRERGTGRVYRDASKDRWVAAITVDGRVTKRLCKSEPEAERAVRELLAKAEAHQLATTNQTVDAFLAEWLVDHVLEHRAARTYEAYKSRISKHVSPRIGKKLLRSIEGKDIRDLYRRLREEGTVTRHKNPKPRPLSPNTIALVHTVLHSAFTWAVRDGRIPVNPCDHVHVPQTVEYEATTFDEEQIPTLLAAIKGHRYEYLWRCQLATGWRHGEATGVRRQDLDIPRLSARIWEALARLPKEMRAVPESGEAVVWWERKRTKTARSRRTTPLSLPAVRAIQAAIAQADAIQAAAGDGWLGHLEPDLIFPDDDGRPLRENKVLRAWKLMLTAAKLPDCRPHDLRHSAAELALEHGAELIDVSRLLGHANTGVTDRVYAGRLNRSTRRAADRLAGAFGDEGSAEADSGASGER